MDYITVHKKNSKSKLKAIFTVAEIVTSIGIVYAVPRGNTRVEILSYTEFWAEFESEAK